jgi:hypothetical protein
MSTMTHCITSTNVHVLADVTNIKASAFLLLAFTARLPDTVIHDARGPRTYQRNLWEFAQPTSVVHVQHDLMPGSVVTPISHEEYLALSAGATVAKVSWPDAKE